MEPNADCTDMAIPMIVAAGQSPLERGESLALKRQIPGNVVSTDHIDA